MRVCLQAQAGYASQAQDWAQRLGLPLCTAEHPRDLVLQVGERLALRQTGPRAPGPVWVEFVGGHAGHRRRHGGGELISRALGLKGRSETSVLDATAGLGQDGWVMATLGCRLTLVERQPLLAALLEDGLRRAGAEASTADIAQRIQLLAQDVRPLLQGDSSWDVVYLDPMFPERRKRAQVNKAMVLFQALLGEETDGDELLALALPRARHRVVVKRPLKAPPLAGQPADFDYRGRSIRYDVYRPKAA